MRKPSNFSSSFKISVKSRLLPEHFIPFQLLYEGVMVPTPALMAVRYPCICKSRSSLSLNRTSPRSSGQFSLLLPLGPPVPKVVPPSPAKCLAHASTLRGLPRSSPCNPLTAPSPHVLADSGVSPYPSYVLPHLSSRGTVTQGARSEEHTSELQ